MWHALRTQGGADRRGPSQSPSRSLETAHPMGRAFALGAKVSGSKTDLLNPWYHGRAEIIPFRYLPVLLGGKGTSHVGWETGNMPSQGKKLQVSNPTRLRFPRRRNACGASAPPHPSGWHALRAGAWHHRRRIVWCRVVAPVAAVPNCPSQGSICDSLQCNCRSQSLEHLRVSDAGGSRRSDRNGLV